MFSYMIEQSKLQSLATPSADTKILSCRKDHKNQNLAHYGSTTRILKPYRSYVPMYLAGLSGLVPKHNVQTHHSNTVKIRYAFRDLGTLQNLEIKLL